MSARADQEFARVDSWLPLLSRAEALSFLSKRIKFFELRYAKFDASEGTSEPVKDPSDPPQAMDFTTTITGLYARKSQVERRVA